MNQTVVYLKTMNGALICSSAPQSATDMKGEFSTSTLEHKKCVKLNPSRMPHDNWLTTENPG